VDKKQPGRPKMYDSPSDKLGAFRKRLESAGFMRKELLVTKETWEQVSELAAENGVSASDAASGLLEFGIRAFKAKAAQRSLPPASAFRDMVASIESPPVGKPRLKPAVNPIADFFVKRRESAQAAISSAAQKGEKE